jgi:hypothetical protein
MLRRPARSKTADSSPLNGSGEYQSAFDLCFVEARWLFFKALEKKNRASQVNFTSPLLTAWEAQNLVSRAVRTREDARARIQSARTHDSKISTEKKN